MNVPAALGRYQVTGTLGEGAMGVVYKGFDPGIGRDVALKTIRRHLMSGADAGEAALARFRNEARAAGRLLHPGIVAVYDFGEDDEVAFIAMEYVEGRSLGRVLGGGLRFGDDDILSVMSQLLEALDHAHANGVWHRDIKPANLILANDGRLKIADFGIARIESMALTQVTSVVGTPGYMAPEQFMGKGVDRRVDIYAAGVVFYQLLTGKAPFTGSPEALMYRVVNEPPVLPSQVPDVGRDRSFDDVIAKALAKDPNDRYDNALAFRQALVQAAGRLPQATLSDDTLISVRRVPTPAVVPAPPPSSASASASAGLGTQWDRAVLTQVETSLAQHLGPMASVLVKRASRECHDLPSLVHRLAEQVTSPAARDAFLAQLHATRGTGSGTRSAPAGTTRPPAAGPAAPPATGGATLVSDELVAASVKVLAQHIGPIAAVVVKRTAAKVRGRDAYFAALAESVPEGDGRTKLLAELAKLKT